MPTPEQQDLIDRIAALLEAQPDIEAELVELPPLSATRDSLLETNKALAAVFFPRARRLAAKIGMT